MKKWIPLLLCFPLSLFALNESDSISIRGAIDHFTIAWNQHDGKRSADYYAKDADFVNIFGMAFSGKREIEDRHVKIHETFLKGSNFEVLDIKMREVTPDVVLTQVFWKVSGVLGRENPMEGIFTHTFVKTGSGWEIASTQNTKIMER